MNQTVQKGSNQFGPSIMISQPHSTMNKTTHGGGKSRSFSRNAETINSPKYKIYTGGQANN